MRSIVLIQPREGVYNKVLRPWVPLSLLSASVKIDHEGYPVKIIDQRVNEEWKNELIQSLAQEPICVGITSMTGSQILGALEASQIVKKYSQTPVVWGGVHPTLFPQQTLENQFIDIVVKGEGEETFYQLVKRLENKISLHDLSGVCYKEDGRIIKNHDRPFIDLDEVPHTPYHLVNINNYLHRFFSEKEVIEVESSRGCPFACAFCYNPLYNKRTWRPLSAKKVVAEIKRLVERYSIRSFHFIDDGFFIDKKRVNKIMQGIIEENLKIKMGFQGVRIDTFDKMSDDDIAILNKAGGRFLQFGVESGSPRILEMINKRLKVNQVISLNRRLAKYPQLIPYYNFMCGFPTETKEDFLRTTSLEWTILKENKNAMISPFHHYKPYPGTALCELSVSRNYDPPENLEEWGHFDWTELIPQGQNRKTLRFLKNVEMVSILVDKKMEKQSDSIFWTIMAKLYRPVARFRFKNNFYSFMPEGRFMMKLKRKY